MAHYYLCIHRDLELVPHIPLGTSSVLMQQLQHFTDISDQCWPGLGSYTRFSAVIH